MQGLHRGLAFARDGAGDEALFGGNDNAASFRMASKNKFGEWHSAVVFRELEGVSL